MLVDRTGKQVAMLSGAEIARQMANENVRIIGNKKPFFERTLENVFSRLHINAA